MRTRKSNFERMAEIDDERDDPEVDPACGVAVYKACPVTVGNTRYPETCVVDVDPGRWPEWFKPFVGMVRRIQPTPEPNYGFVTDNFNTFTVHSYVADNPGDSYYLYKRLLDAVRKAGWDVQEWKGGRRFDAFQP